MIIDLSGLVEAFLYEIAENQTEFDSLDGKHIIPMDEAEVRSWFENADHPEVIFCRYAYNILYFAHNDIQPSLP